jgi:hypothetical protein
MNSVIACFRELTLDGQWHKSDSVEQEVVAPMNRSFLIAIGIVVLISGSIGQSQTRQRESLRGLNGVYVYVQPVAKEVEAGGLPTIQIQTVVEKQLRGAGISVQSEPQPANGSATLVIVIGIVKRPAEEAYVFDVEVSLLQAVRLARRDDPDLFPAQTWSQKALGITGPKRMDLILEPLKVRLADFVSDYLRANTKPQS